MRLTLVRIPTIVHIDSEVINSTGRQLRDLRINSHISFICSQQLIIAARLGPPTSLVIVSTDRLQYLLRNPFISLLPHRIANNILDRVDWSPAHVSDQSQHHIQQYNEPELSVSTLLVGPVVLRRCRWCVVLCLHDCFLCFKV